MKMTRQEAGRKGGQATLAKYGQPHFSAIGYAGAQATAERHFDGDEAKMMRVLRSRRKSRAVWDDTLKCWKVPSPSLS